MPRTCEWCGKVFIGRRNQRWCSAECRHEGMRVHWKTYSRDNYERFKERGHDLKEDSYENALMAVLSLSEARRAELAWLLCDGNRKDMVKRWLEA